MVDKSEFSKKEKILFYVIFTLWYFVFRAVIASNSNREVWSQGGGFGIPQTPFEGVGAGQPFQHNFIFLIRGVVVEILFMFLSGIVFVLLVVFLYLAWQVIVSIKRMLVR